MHALVLCVLPREVDKVWSEKSHLIITETNQ